MNMKCGARVECLCAGHRAELNGGPAYEDPDSFDGDGMDRLLLGLAPLPLTEVNHALDR